MSPLIVLFSSILAATVQPDGVPNDADLSAYQAEQAKVGRDAESHVRLALWCEAHGMSAERLKHLATAVLADPANATARGFLGLVFDGGRWRHPEAVVDRVKSDAELSSVLAQYNDMRNKTQNTADAQWKLGLWCEQHGLKAEAAAHFTAVTRLDSRNEPAWKRLGFKKHNGRWMTDAQITAERQEVDAQAKADKHWKPLLEKWRGWLSEKDAKRRAEADRRLSEIHDPRAIRSVWQVFGNGGGADQERAARLFGQMDGPTASRAIALMAVWGKSAESRRIASETLTARDPREFIGMLIAQIREPIPYEVKRVGGPGSPGALFVEGKEYNFQRRYSPPAVADWLRAGDTLTFDAYGLPVANRVVGYYETPVDPKDPFGTGPVDLRNAPEFSASAPEAKHADRKHDEKTKKEDPKPNVPPPTEQPPRFREEIVRPIIEQVPIGQMMVQAQASAAAAERQLEADVAVLEQTNAKIGEVNDRSTQILKAATGQVLGADRKAWQDWWTDQQGYSTGVAASRRETEKPTFFEEAPLSVQPQPIPATLVLGPGQLVAYPYHSCFAAGTKVRTRSGVLPIETIRPGDLVLTQDVKTGGLSYQPVLAAYHNPPNQTLKVTLAGEPVVVTGIHRFWKAGKGWTMARELKPGDAVRCLGDLARVESVEDEKVQPVFNLEVADGHSFFVGGRGVLVHDNSPVRPTHEPFDAPTAAAHAVR